MIKENNCLICAESVKFGGTCKQKVSNCPGFKLITCKYCEFFDPYDGTCDFGYEINQPDIEDHLTQKARKTLTCNQFERYSFEVKDTCVECKYYHGNGELCGYHDQIGIFRRVDNVERTCEHFTPKTIKERFEIYDNLEGLIKKINDDWQCHKCRGKYYHDCQGKFDWTHSCENFEELDEETKQYFTKTYGTEFWTDEKMDKKAQIKELKQKIKSEKTKRHEFLSSFFKKRELFNNNWIEVCPELIEHFNLTRKEARILRKIHWGFPCSGEHLKHVSLNTKDLLSLCSKDWTPIRAILKRILDDFDNYVYKSTQIELCRLTRDCLKSKRRVCPDCNTKNIKKAVFCSGCGRRLQPLK